MLSPHHPVCCHQVDGHHIRVDRAAPVTKAASKAGADSAGITYDPMRSVFVGNLDFKVADEDIIRAFNDGSKAPELEAAVEAVRVVRDPKTNIGKGFAFVLFTSKAAARAALSLDGTPLNDRPMRVTRVTKGSGAPGGKANGNIRKHAGGTHQQHGGSPNPRGNAGKGSPAQHGAPRGKPGSGGRHGGNDWQGIRTKGKGLKLRGPKRNVGGSSKAGGSSKRVVPDNRSRAGKRPTVAARKAVGSNGTTPPGGQQQQQQQQRRPQQQQHRQQRHKQGRNKAHARGPA